MRVPRHHPDQHDAAAQSRHREVGDDVVAADQLEDDVDVPDRVGDVGGQRGGIELAGGEHRVVEPEGPRLVELLRGAGGAHDGAPGRPAELHGGGAHTRTRPHARAAPRPAASRPA